MQPLKWEQARGRNNGRLCTLNRIAQTSGSFVRARTKARAARTIIIRRLNNRYRYAAVRQRWDTLGQVPRVFLRRGETANYTRHRRRREKQGKISRKNLRELSRARGAGGARSDISRDGSNAIRSVIYRVPGFPLRLQLPDIKRDTGRRTVINIFPAEIRAGSSSRESPSDLYGCEMRAAIETTIRATRFETSLYP